MSRKGQKSRMKPASARPHKAALTERSDLLETCRTKWQYADWSGLAEVKEELIVGDEARGKVALLVAIAQAQSGGMKQARYFARRAVEWGSPRETVARFLISSVHNSLARAGLGLEDDAVAKSHFKNAIALVEPHGDHDLLTQIRVTRENMCLGLFPQAGQSLAQEVEFLRGGRECAVAWRLDSLAADVAVLQAELRSARKRSLFSAIPQISRHKIMSRKDVHGPFVVVAAGVPRSGSTWLFNAARLVCERAGVSCYADWCADYDPASHQDSEIHLVKVHSPDQLSFPYHRILTSHRDMIERLASLLRMGWVERNADSLRKTAESLSEFDFYWAERSDLEVEFEDIMDQPDAQILQIAHVLDVDCDAVAAEGLAAQLASLPEKKVRPNARGHDTTTLLHPDHQATEEQRQENIAFVRKVLAAKRGA